MNLLKFVVLLICSLQLTFARGLIETFESLELKKFVELIKESGLEEEFDNLKNVSILAPTDLAFEDIEIDLEAIKAEPDVLTDILKYHVGIEREKLEDSLKSGSIKTLNGRKINVKSNIAGIFVNNQIVVIRNINKEGVMIHLIDELLIPTANTPYNNIKLEKNINPNLMIESWNELYRIPNKNQKDCFNAKTEFSVKKNKFRIKNFCTNIDGKVKIANGSAKITGEPQIGKFKFRYGLFSSAKGKIAKDFNILFMDVAYQIAMVGTSDKKGLWIFSRETEIREELFNRLLQIAFLNGFDTINLIASPKLVKDSEEVPETTPETIPETNPEQEESNNKLEDL